MGQQATIDLPDPAEKTTTAPASADDLLSQLAGQEIDRLLADAETQIAESGVTVEPIPDTTAVDEVEKMLASSQALLEETVAAAAAAAPEGSAPSAAATDDAYSNQMDALFKELNGNLPAAAPDPAPTSAPAIAEIAAPPADIAPINPTPAAPLPASLAPAAPSMEEQTTSAERAALTTTLPPTPAAPQSAAQQLSSAVQEIPEEPLPIYLRVLELINFPLNACPDAIRETLGKAAILTLMNALGVLLYVVLFKR